MKSRDLFDLVLLAAIWGASFLLMRIASPAFGPLPLIELRVAIAALVLLPLLAVRGGLSALRTKFVPLLVVAFSNSALPFVLYAWALLSVTAGFAAVANASAPLWAALIAYLWLRDRLGPGAVLGLFVGFSGVLVLCWDQLGFRDGSSGWAVPACIGATLSYGIAANYTKQRLAGVTPLTVAAGSQVYAALMLMPLAAHRWPQVSPGLGQWCAVIALGVVCTGFAYFLYFRLIERLGPSRAISVTFLVPAFGMLWGVLFLDEALGLRMIVGCLTILAGTALASGLFGRAMVRRAGG